MLTKIFKLGSVIALLAVIALQPSAGYALLAEFLVCAAAVMAAAEAFQTGKLALAIVFVLMAGVFNPVFSLGLSQPVFMGAVTFSLATFLLSLLTVRTRPRLSMVSITDRTPGSESL